MDKKMKRKCPEKFVFQLQSKVGYIFPGNNVDIEGRP
jgi:hypothetical protein